MTAHTVNQLFALTGLVAVGAITGELALKVWKRLAKRWRAGAARRLQKKQQRSDEMRRDLMRAAVRAAALEPHQDTGRASHLSRGDWRG